MAVLKEDKRAIFSAAAHAQRAADYRPGKFIGGEEPISKFGSVAVAIVPEKEPVVRARKPLDVSARALKR